MQNKKIEIIKNQAYLDYLGSAIKNRKLWEKLIVNWVKVMKNFISVYKNDIPYWYDEDANTSFFAAAASKIGASVIEQYKVDRVYRKTQTSKGLCDLRMIKLTKKGRFDFSVEAKKAWNSTTNSKELKKSIDGKLNEAAEQFETIKNKENLGQCQVALCFLSPETAKNDFFKKDKKKFKDAVLEAFKERENIIIASYFPNINIKRFKDNDKYYPGVVLIAKILKANNV
jgi:hypothetical protein